MCCFCVSGVQRPGASSLGAREKYRVWNLCFFHTCQDKFGECFDLFLCLFGLGVCLCVSLAYAKS